MTLYVNVGVQAAGSGAPVHFHCDAWNALAHGRKRWFLYPPAVALYSKQPIAKWLAEQANRTSSSPSSLGDGGSFSLESAAPEGAITCTQRAGDVLYVPCDWGHGVLNLRHSVGVAVEFSWGHGQRG